MKASRQLNDRCVHAARSAAEAVASKRPRKRSLECRGGIATYSRRSGGEKKEGDGERLGSDCSIGRDRTRTADEPANPSHAPPRKRRIVCDIIAISFPDRLSCGCFDEEANSK
jgi:hypothetical protein